MKLLCWNVNSLAPTVRNAVLRYGSWLGFFEAHGIDILCLQESKVPEDKLTKELCCVEGFQSFWAISREKKGYSGATTYVSETWAPCSCKADCLGTGDDDIDREGRVVLTDHGAFVLINVYVPNAGDRPDRARLPYKLRFLAALKQRCDELAAEGRQLLVVGDFNVPAEERDVHPSLVPADGFDALYTAAERAALHALSSSYSDVWRHLHPDVSSSYTVWNERTSARAFNQGLRIDYVLCTPGLLANIVSCEVLSTDVLPAKWSDHAGMLLELADVEPLPPHTPCKEWQRLYRRFVDVGQKSILGMFQRKRPPTAAPTEPAGQAARADGTACVAEAARPTTDGAVALQTATTQQGDGGKEVAGSSGISDGGGGMARKRRRTSTGAGTAVTVDGKAKQQEAAKAREVAAGGQRTIGSFFAAGGGKR